MFAESATREIERFAGRVVGREPQREGGATRDGAVRLVKRLMTCKASMAARRGACSLGLTVRKRSSWMIGGRSGRGRTDSAESGIATLFLGLAHGPQKTNTVKQAMRARDQDHWLGRRGRRYARARRHRHCRRHCPHWRCTNANIMEFDSSIFPLIVSYNAFGCPTELRELGT